MKKILSFILIVLMVFSITAVNAFNDIAGIQSENDIKILRGIGIIEPDESYRPESYITRGEFFVMTARLMGSTLSDAQQAAEYLNSLGIVGGYGNGDFGCESAITYNEAVKILVTVLGYERDAEAMGGWFVGYVSVAANLNVIKPGEIKSGNDNVTRGMAATLLVRAGNTETAQKSYRDNNVIFGPMGGDTLFYENFKITLFEGIIDANSATSLERPSGVTLNSFRIGTETIDAGNTNAKEYLGFYVQAYCIEDEGYKAVAVVPVENKNSVLRINSKSGISATGTLQEFEISYYLADGKIKRAKVADYDAVYNGCSYPGFRLSDLQITSGDVILLDNDSDGVYEVVFINNYETYVVETVNVQAMKVYDKYGRILELNDDNEQLKIIDLQGAYTDMASISANQILSVKKSPVGNVITVHIVKDVEKGMITGIENADGVTRITVGNQKLDISYDFETLVHANKTEPFVGLEAEFYLDVEGKVADIRPASSSIWKYGYVVSVNSGDDDGKLYFKLYTTNNKFERFEAVEKLNVDGNTKKVSAFTYTEVSEMSRQLVRYQAENSILKKLDTIVYGSNETDESLSGVTGITNADYMANSKIFYSGKNTLYGGTDSTVVFQIPINEANFNDVRYFSVGKLSSFFSDKSTYNNLDFYNVNDAGIAEVLVYRLNDGMTVSSSNTSFAVIDSVSVEVDSNGEVVQKVKGIRQNGNAFELFTESDGVIGSEIKQGDFIRIREKNGKIVAVRKDFDFSTEYNDIYAFTQAGSYYSQVNICCGYLTYADNSHIVLSNSDNSQNVTFAIGGKTVLMADTEEETVSKISASDLTAYIKERNPQAKVSIATSNGNVLTVVVHIQ